MRAFISTLLLLLLKSYSLFAQDVIVFKDGNQVDAKVYEITLDEVKFKRFDNLDGPIYAVYKRQIDFIQYENGNRDYFKNEGSSATDLRNNAINDAMTFYQANNTGAGWVAAVNIVISPLFGLIPAVACASTAPARKNLDLPYPDENMDPFYLENYTKTAHQMKKKKIWRNYGISAGVWLAIILLLPD